MTIFVESRSVGAERVLLVVLAAGVVGLFAIGCTAVVPGTSGEEQGSPVMHDVEGETNWHLLEAARGVEIRRSPDGKAVDVLGEREEVVVEIRHRIAEVVAVGGSKR